MEGKEGMKSFHQAKRLQTEGFRLEEQATKILHCASRSMENTLHRAYQEDSQVYNERVDSSNHLLFLDTFR